MNQTKVKRTRTPVEPELTWPEVQKKLGEYTGVTDILTRTELELESKLNEIRKEYQAKIDELKESQGGLLKTLKKWAIRNKKTLFKDKKSKDFLFGKVGFRTGTHKLKTLKGYTWDEVLAKVAEYAPGYIRTTSKLDKQGLINSRDSEEVQKLLPIIGVKVAQDESFYVELKTENTEGGSDD